jgi:hypothetical protein
MFVEASLPEPQRKSREAEAAANLCMPEASIYRDYSLKMYVVERS